MRTTQHLWAALRGLPQLSVLTKVTRSVFFVRFGPARGVQNELVRSRNNLGTTAGRTVAGSAGNSDSARLRSDKARDSLLSHTGDRRVEARSSDRRRATWHS